MKYRSLLLIILLLVISSSTNSLALENSAVDIVQPFISCLKSGNREALSTMIDYPLKRLDPLPSVDSPGEFLQRFTEIFDNELIKAILNSDIKSDWHDMGERGIMLSNGLIWLDHDGMVIAVNYESVLEGNKRADLIREIIESRKKPQNPGFHDLPDSQGSENPKTPQTVTKPVIEWKTNNHRIRIEYLDNGKYKYLAWPIEKEPTEEPSLILTSDVVTYDGTGGNHYYEFTNGSYSYQCWVNLIGTSESPRGVLKVYKNGELILAEPVVEPVSK